MSKIDEATKEMIESALSIMEAAISHASARIADVERVLELHINPPPPPAPVSPEDGEYWNINWHEKGYASDIIVLVIRADRPACGKLDGEVWVHVRKWGFDKVITETYEIYVPLSDFNYEVTNEECIESFWKGEWD